MLAIILEASFRNSGATVITYAGDEIVGKARALTDSAQGLYEKAGFKAHGIGMGQVVGQ